MDPSITMRDRASFYAKAFPKFPPLRVDDRWLDGMWIMGNMYKTSGYYGAYPHGYLKRIMSMFPDCERILHLFSGSLPPGHYTRFDINSDLADLCGDAEKLSSYFPGQRFDLIMADPPYSEEDALHYGKAMVNRNRVIRECVKVLESRGFIVWLDQVLPMFSKAYLNMVGVIGMVRSTNHRFRVATIFQGSK